MLTLHAVASAPGKATSIIELSDGGRATLRPLVATDEEPLCDFFDGLGPETRLQYDVVDGRAHATEMCSSVPTEESLRLVLVAPRSSTLIGLVELSFDLPFSDVVRYQGHGQELCVGTDARYAICLADAQQGAALGAAVWSSVVDLLRGFGCRRVLLWGGVYAANQRARRHYRRLGFREVGDFAGAGGQRRTDMIIEL